MPRALKVYRMPVGFHDAYVAASSQKDAIAAWGSDKDVFSRGQAEIVTDPDFTAEPLASPGKVIKRLRATAAEQIEAAGKVEGRTPKRKPAAKAPAAKPKPRPSRAKLDAAQRSIADLEATHAAALRDLDKQEAALRRDREALKDKQKREMAQLEAKRDHERANFDDALARWRG